MHRFIAMLTCAMILLCSCTPERTELSSSEVEASLSTSKPSSSTIEPEDTQQKLSYIQQLAEEKAGQLIPMDSQQEEKIRILYRYLVEKIWFADPVGLDIWRYASDESEAIPYIENRALSPLLFEIGSCEDFAAAMVMLLRAVGFEAEYVAGYTLSVDQVYIDHAWTVVKLDGEWYHIDPQLEQNVTRKNRLTYRYYLKSDRDFAIDHKWGENLIEYYSAVTPQQSVNIRENYMPPICNSTYPSPESESIPLPDRPNMADVEEKIRRIKAGKEELPALYLNVEPPVLIDALHITPLLLPNQRQEASAYGRSFMTGYAASLYDELVVSMRSPADGMEIAVPSKLDSEQAGYVATTFLDANPLYYWAEFTVEAAENQRVLRLSMNISAEEIAKRELRIQECTQQILESTQGLSDFDKALAIHDRVAVLSYDKEKAGKDSANIYGALVGETATCDGYAQSFQYIATASGLESVYIRGYSMKGVPHAWNAVKLDGSWHYIDCTWDRPLQVYDDVFHDYFLMDEAEMLSERKPEYGQYPELPHAGDGFRSYYERMGYAVLGKVPSDSVDIMAEILYRQLAAKNSFPKTAQPVYLEFKVSGDQSTYEEWKQIYIKQVFQVLQKVSAQAEEQNAAFSVVDISSVKCDFNDTSQVLSFYPNIEGKS